MALDQQRNWDISMAENLAASKRNGKGGGTPQKEDEMLKSADTGVYPTWTENPVYLPDEILLEILSYVATTHHAQKTLASCCLLSHQWYEAAVPLLYAYPYLYGVNFDPFVRAICPSINLHVRKSPLSELVKSLNMANLVHQGSKSLTARLLGRTKGNLEVFVAPQASFAMNCFPALSKCTKLRTLDLSLVSESPPLPELFKTVSHLSNLRTFRLPRSAGFGVHHKPPLFSWPPALEDLSLSGGIDAHFLHGVVAFPQTLKSLTIEHCPLAKGFAVTHLLKTAVRPLKNLESFKLRMMPRLGAHALDDLLFLLPQVKKLSVSVDYITPALFDEGHLHHLQKDYTFPTSTDSDDLDAVSETPLQHSNLRHLELTNSGNPGVEDKISPIDIMIAIDDGVLPKLRQVRVAKSLLWHSSSTASDAEALADVLQEASKRDWDDGGDAQHFRGLDRREGERRRVWEEVAGVWMFDT
ncbi:hypothetical protein B0A50_06493 [Salinomyces thailandicus]|uniref:F-box domain-containing protein n=1 Tax=Salinomyces thailandicus TaxID=706561 RepID=A0A4U0TNZ1_9PEZI|nr:hypothetical protein B0A50_06493 [Salinomyces thailandica]